MTKHRQGYRPTLFPYFLCGSDTVPVWNCCLKGDQDLWKDEVRSMNTKHWWHGGESKASGENCTSITKSTKKKSHVNRCRSVPGERPATIRLRCASSRNYFLLTSGVFCVCLYDIQVFSQRVISGAQMKRYIQLQCPLSVLGFCHVVSESGTIKLQDKLIFCVRHAALFCYLQCRWPPYHFGTNYPYCQLLDEFPSDEI